MRIAWFTPTTKNTSISEFSASVLKPLLELGCVADVYTFDDTFLGVFEDLKTLKIRLRNVADFDSSIYDYCIYNFGNNWENHGEIFKFAAVNPGIVIMHDAALHHVIAYYCLEIKKDRSLYTNLMIRYYGYEGARILNASMIDSPKPKFAPWDSAFGPDYSFIDFFAKNQIGCVFNSQYAANKITSTSMPLLTLRLPGDEKGDVDMEEVEAWRRKFKDASTVTLCSLGYINSAKNIELIFATLQALRKDGVDAKLLILGGSSDAKYLKTLENKVEAMNLTKFVEFHLNLSRRDFDSVKIKSDIFISLRYPNYEGCSAAAFESMQTGRPLVCLSSGPFEEIPSDAVVHAPDLNPDLIANNIKILLSKKSALFKIGQKGLDYSSSYKSLNYAKDLVGFLKSDEVLRRKNHLDFEISGFRSVEVDNYFFGPANIFLDESSQKSVSALLSINPFKSFFASDISRKYLSYICDQNPLLYWDIVGYIKSLISGRYKSVTIDLSKRRGFDLDIFLRVLSLAENKILLVAFLMPLIGKKIDVEIFNEKKDFDVYLLCVNMLESSKYPAIADFFKTISASFLQVKEEA